ncbi:hypothetical protein [Chryseobacterium viscerum]|uniref:VCBS repeat-containing protein n=1 Tax=Chryseobacterium viscerum TaxID=1037377 RepID=A0A5N4BTH1_9FLAO|nr:hypothetical protein [Chryseobacterium viscerum]KAB1231375.1 hypothetical protein F8D52_06085 [Chryseobacterium viscerum]
MKTIFISTLFIILFFQNSIVFNHSICNDSLLHGMYEKNNKIPDSFIINTPFKYNGKNHNIQLLCEKDSFQTNISSITSNLTLPEEFYAILQDNFGLATWLINSDYQSAYEDYKNLKFKRTDFVEYEKNSGRKFSSKLLYISDVDQDGYDDILLLNLQSSTPDNDVYAMFKGGKNGISYKEKFFDKVAFYGWDKTGKYLITGVSDTKERKLYKNTIVGGQLKTVDQCTEYAVSDKFCW